MICFGYIYFDWFEARWVLRSLYDKYFHKFDSWFVLSLLGEWEVPSDFQETFDRLDKSIYKF